MPLCIDLFCGLGGWTRGFLAEGWDCIGFDIERHEYVTSRSHFGGLPKTHIHRYPAPAQLVLQDVLTLHGSQFRDADCIVASPPCQEFSYMAMPWKRGKQIAAGLRSGDPNSLLFPAGYPGSRTVADLCELFNACFRIQTEASQAAGRHIPLIVENVKGAEPWVGRAKANYGSYYLWGSVGSVGGRIVPEHGVVFGADSVKAFRGRMKFPADCGPRMWKDCEVMWLNDGESAHAFHLAEGQKRNPDGTNHGTGSWFAVADSKARGASTKGFVTGLGLGHDWRQDPSARFNSKSDSRKAASAMIAEIPFDLARWVAWVFKPEQREACRA